MGILRQSLQRIRSFFHKQDLDADFNTELLTHLDLAIEDNLQRGMPPEKARHQALISLGGIQQTKESQRNARGLPWLDILLQDLRYTLRTLKRDRAFTLIAIVILGLGIGANIAVFSVVNTVLLRPLPFHNPQQLVRLLSKNTTGGESSMTYTTDAMQELQQRNRSFQQISGYFAFSSNDNFKLVQQGQPLPVTGMMVAGNFFKTLTVEPFLGRQFTAEESLPNSRPATLLSHAFWKRQFAADTSIVGRTINLSGSLVTVVGVLPETFDFGSIFSPGAKIDLFRPVIMEDIRDEGNTMALIGRLNPGVNLSQAQAEADLIFPQLDFNLRHPSTSNYTGRLLELKDYVSGKLRRSLIMLWCAVGLILLIVCVNLSNLLLARSAARSKEFALRSALGANHGRLIRQLLTESLVLSGAGALFGLAIAFAIITYIAHQTSLALPLLSSLRIDGSALIWTILIAFATAVLFGLTPALRLSGNDLQKALKDSGRGTSEGKNHERVRSVLVISEIALACMLLVGAGLLLRSFLRVLDVDLGFEPSRAAALHLDLDDGGDSVKRIAQWQQVLQRVNTLPGIETAGISDNLPLSRNRSWGISAKGKEYHKGELESTFTYIVSPGYLNAIGMHLVKGRDFNWQDLAENTKVVIINETVAHRLWPGEDPVNRIAQINGKDTLVIGVIADVRESSVEGGAGWQMYLPVTQQGPDGAELIIRTRLPEATLSTSVMGVLRELNPGQPATEFLPLQRLVDHAVSPRRFFAMLVSLFALLGLILAALGIYGVISYSVTQRTQEIGIRMALGATMARVQLSVVSATLRLALIGIAVGTVASIAASHLIASLLFGTASTDPITFTAMILLLATTALLAGYIPARRASRIDPMVALRND